jgi:glycosyltransferase involved in cell wall biosynthesis
MWQDDGPILIRPRILHVATRYLQGGSERRLRDIVRSVPEAEHHLVLGGDSDVELAMAEVGPARIGRVPSLVRDPDPFRDLAALRHLSRLIGRQRYDLVVTHQSKAGVLARVAAARHGVPVIHSLSMANFGPGYARWQSAVFRAIESRLVRETTSYMVVGADLARRYAEIGAPSEKLHIVRSGVSLTALPERDASRAATCRRLGVPADRQLLLYLGSLEPRKNVMDLPRFLRRILSESTARPFLAVAGEGPLAGPLEASFAASGLGEHARLLGFVHEPGALVQAADAVVLLSSAEGVPQVLVQAAAAQTPFVAYDVDGVRELIELGAEGVVVPLGDVAAAAAAARELLERGRGTSRPPVDLSPWTPEVISAGYRSVIGQALGRRTQRDPRLQEALG